MSQTFTVPRISNGPASAATFNAPLDYIQTALNTLAGQTDASITSGALLRWQVPVASQVSVGDLVYYKKPSGSDSTGLFKKALAALSSQVGTDGQAIEEDSCHVQGIILSIDSTANSAVMLCNGYYESDVVFGAIGSGAAPGLYYLSTTTAGKATLTPGWDVRFPCINYYGDGKFTMISNYYAHIGDGDSVVRGILSSTLTTSNNQGTVSINLPQKTYNSPSASAYAVSGITNTSVSMTPIVSMLLNGPGIKTSYKGDGLWSIAMDYLVNKPLTATQFTLNGAQRVADTLLTYTVFPAGSNASMVMTMPVDFTSSTAFQGAVKVWLTTRGPGAGSFSVVVYWIPYSGSPVTIANCQIGTTSIGANNTSTTQLKYAESTQIPNVQLNTAGVLVAKITSSGSLQDMYIHQAGFKLNVEEVSDSSSDSPASTELIRQQIINILSEYLVFNPNYSGM